MKRRVGFFSNFEVHRGYRGRRSRWAPGKFDRGKHIVTGRKPGLVVLVVVWDFFGFFLEVLFIV